MAALYNEPESWALYIARSIYTLVEATTVSQPYTALRIVGLRAPVKTRGTDSTFDVQPLSHRSFVTAVLVRTLNML
jgi:hypothetical protein